MDINDRHESNEGPEALDEEFKIQADNLDKARNLLSSRMQDVRALKRMVSETKETLENKRRLRILKDIQ